MKLRGKRRLLSRYIAAARSDLPRPEALRDALGALLPPAFPSEPVVPQLGTPAVSTLTKVALAGALALVLGGALWAVHEPARPPAVPVLETRLHSGASPTAATPLAFEIAPQVSGATPAASTRSEVGSGTRTRSAQDVRRRSGKASVDRAALEHEALARATPTSPPAPARTTSDSVEEEAAVIEAARKALHQDPARTLQLTAAHAQQFPAGLLGVEREALGIHALVLLGRVPEAEARLGELRRLQPRSIHVTRLTALLEAQRAGSAR